MRTVRERRKREAGLQQIGVRRLRRAWTKRRARAEAASRSTAARATTSGGDLEQPEQDVLGRDQLSARPARRSAAPTRCTAMSAAAGARLRGARGRRARRASRSWTTPPSVIAERQRAASSGASSTSDEQRCARAPIAHVLGMLGGRLEHPPRRGAQPRRHRPPGTGRPVAQSEDLSRERRRSRRRARAAPCSAVASPGSASRPSASSPRPDASRRPARSLRARRALALRRERDLTDGSRARRRRRCSTTRRAPPRRIAEQLDQIVVQAQQPEQHVRGADVVVPERREPRPAPAPPPADPCSLEALEHRPARPQVRRAGKRITSRIERPAADEHRQAVDPEAEARRRRHAEAQRLDVVQVERLGVLVTRLAASACSWKRRSCSVGVVQLG